MTTNKRPKVWIGVISRAHVERGVAGGFTQVCHGRRAPLARMHPGDWFIAYSPTTELGGGVRLQAFTALGQVRDDVITQVDLGGGFRPFRRAIDWVPVRPVELEAVRASLEFVRDGGWGLEARRGHFEVSTRDGEVLRDAMLGRSPSAGVDASTP
ncbi:MAG: EVE domain-containing protein [Myxococcaceae bacterium]|jgi:hypothetical protein|nr:EVE domain-containing protein [Myxococcaceae bacterium]